MILAELHDILQTAMGWDRGHSHEFSVGKRRFGLPNPESRLMGMPTVENERSVRLSIIGKIGSRIITPMILATAGSMTLSWRRSFRKIRI